MNVIATIATALISSIVGALVGAIVSKVKTTTKDAQDMREMQRLNLMMTCRMAVYDSHFSVDEKLEAYEIYRDYGGNHQTKTYMDELVKCDVDDYIEKHRKKD
ncbi:MAG: hypothetical protein IKE20_07210 [Eggerthellaceae bacterium]|nr:hypothetical protein [Eggerthellaceae bacterium]